MVEAGGWHVVAEGGERERSRKVPGVEAPCSCPKGFGGDGARLAPRQRSAAGLLPLEGAGYPSCSPGTEAPGDVRLRALIFCPSVSNLRQGPPLATREPWVPTFPGNMTRLSWCFSCVIRWGKYLFSCLLPLRLCLLSQVTRHLAPDSSLADFSFLRLMDYLSLSGTHHCGLVSFALVIAGNPGESLAHAGGSRRGSSYRFTVQMLSIRSLMDSSGN